jgi:hypothetical protein
MKNLILIAFLILTNISFSQTFKLIGSKTANLIKTGTGQYKLKYKEEYSDYIYTDQITRQRRKEGTTKKYLNEGAFGGLGSLGGILSPNGASNNEVPVVPAVYEFCKTDDPDYEIVIMWANIFWDYSKPFKGVVGKISVLGEMTDMWLIAP